MISVFTKPLEALTAADVVELSVSGWPEGYEVEFKESLPDKKGKPSSWLRSTPELGEYARDEILGEVIAFANSKGGSLILGISETQEKPPRASKITAIPNAGELARRFEDAARDCIDPPLSRLQIKAVETEPSMGVLIFRVPASRQAPHRLTTTKECYVRRGSSTMRMAMREIQDMSLNLARGLALVEATFAERSQKFQEWVSRNSRIAAVRVTALPLWELPDPGRLASQAQEFFPGAKIFRGTIGAMAVQLDFPVNHFSPRPCLRGVVRAGSTGPWETNWELQQSGLSDLYFGARPREGTTVETSLPILRHQEVMAGVANSLFEIDNFRKLIGAPDAEYGIEIQIRDFADQSRQFEYIEGSSWYWGFFFESGGDQYKVPNLTLPRYSVGSAAEFGDLLSIINTDIYDALGSGRQVQALKIDFDV